MSALDVLQSHKLARIAEALCREMSLRTMAELAGLTDAEIERILVDTTTKQEAESSM